MGIQGGRNKYYIMLTILLSFVALGAWVLARYQNEAFAFIKQSLDVLQTLGHQHPLQMMAGYSGLYLVSLLALLPSDTVFMLLGGALYSLWFGTLLTCTVHTFGTMGMFYASRHLLRRSHPDAPDGHARFLAANTHERRNAWLTLLLMRMAPLVPTHGISVMMANSALSAQGFFTATWLGTLPMALFLVYMGQRLATIERLNDLVTPGIVAAMCCMAAFVLVMKTVVNRMTKRQAQ